VAITFIQQKDANGTGNSQAVTFTSNVTAGDLLVVAIGAAAAPLSVTSVTDTRTNSYTNRSLATGNDGINLSVAIYDCVSASSGANTVTVVVSNSGTFLEVKVWQFHTTSGTWTYETGNKASGSADPAISGNITTAQTVDAIVGFAGIFGTAGSYGSGWTGTNTASGNVSAYRITSATGTYQFSCAQGGINRYMGCIAAYYAAGAPPTQTFPMAIVDTSAVSLGFHGAAKRFPMAVVDTSAVTLGFHGVQSSFTVGPTTPGNSTGAYFGLTASQVTMSQSGTLQSLSINWFSDAGNNFILGVYADNAGVPGTLLATTAPAVSTIGIQTLPTTTHIGMVSGSKYWLTVQTQNPIGGYFDSTGLGAFYGSQPWTGALPTIWGSSSTGAFTFSIYATLNPGVPTPHFPLNVADTSTVTLGFHGAGAHFPVIVADTSTVTLGFRKPGVRFPLTVADTSTVSLGFHTSVTAFTVGPTAPGPSSGNYSGITASQITLTQRALLQSISVFWSVGGAGQPYLLGIYSDVSGSPGALLGSSALGTSVAGLNTQSFGAGPELPPGNYWLAVQVNTPISGYFDSTTGIGAFNGSEPWTGALPSTFTSAGSGTFTFSLYATFTPSNNVHFPLKPRDTSSVNLGFHGISFRFPMAVADTSAVAISFHQGANAPFNVGATTPGSSTGAYNGLTATQVAVAQTGTLQSLSIFWFSDAGNNFLLGVYSDNAGVPGTLLATTEVGVSVIGLQTLPVTANNVVLTKGNQYWITVQTQAGIGGYFDSTTGVGAFYGSQPWTGALPTTWGGANTGTFTFSLYATLSPGVPPLRFPMTIADTSHVILGFQGAPKRFAMVVSTVSTVNLGFHGATISTPLTVRYIKTTATGTGDGKSWTNAAAIALVNSAGAADWCFYLAGGTYPPQGFTASGSGPTHPVYVRRASANDPLCTAGAGWNSAFDAQVIITQGVDLPANFTLDGNKWSAPGMPSTFGIRVTFVDTGASGKGIDAPNGGNTIRNVEVLGPGFNVSQHEYDLIFIGPNSLISGCALHDSDALIKSWAGGSNVTVEYCWLYNVSSDIVHTHDPGVSPHPDIWYNSSGQTNMTVRWCVIANVVSEGFFFDHDQGIGGSNMVWYGNLMFQGDTQGDAGGGWGAVPIEFQNSLSFGSVFFYNNTFVDWNKANYLGNGTATIDPASAFKNNLWINCDPGDIPTAKLSFNGFSSTPGNGSGSNATVNPASPFTGPYNPSVGFSSSGSPPGTRVYPGSPGADPPGYDPSTFLNNFQLTPSTSWALGKGTSISPYNTDMFGNTGLNLGCFQTPGSGPPPGTQHFPLNVATTSGVALGFHSGAHFPLVVRDTSTVVIGWHGAAPVKFQLVAIDTSTVNLGFHWIQRFALTAADTSTVFLGISHAIQHFPLQISTTSTVNLGWHNDHYHQPLTVPPYSGQSQPIDINANDDIEHRETLRETTPRVVPPYAPTPAPLMANEPGGTDVVPPPISKTDLWSAMQEWPL
jgi:hypothetical protein